MKKNKSSNQVAGGLVKYIRIRSEPGARFVEFDFAINDPTLYVELIMPPQSFADFCRHNEVVEMSAAQMAQNDAEAEKWRYGDNTLVGRLHQTQQAV